MSHRRGGDILCWRDLAQADKGLAAGLQGSGCSEALQEPSTQVSKGRGAQNKPGGKRQAAREAPARATQELSCDMLLH